MATLTVTASVGSPSGAPLGMFTVLMTPTMQQIATGPHTPCSFPLTVGQDYILQVQDYVVNGAGHVFSHYILPNGQTSTTRNLPISIATNSSIIAIFNAVP